MIDLFYFSDHLFLFIIYIVQMQKTVESDEFVNYDLHKNKEIIDFFV